MCNTYYAHFPCNHTILAGYIPCTKDTHSKACNPKDIQTRDMSSAEALALGFRIPATCPNQIHQDNGLTNTEACIRVPTHPPTFALYCLSRNLAISDVVALAPAWVFDIEGKKIGSQARPWRVTDYVVAYYMARNPVAKRNRVSKMARVKRMSRKPGEAYREERVAKRLRLEKWVEGAAVKIEGEEV